MLCRSGTGSTVSLLGFQPGRVFVEHPIQDRTDDEMVTIADKAVEAIVEKLTG